MGPNAELERALGSLMAGTSFFIAAIIVARIFLSILLPDPGQETLALLPVAALFLGFGSLGLWMRLRQTSKTLTVGWVPPRRTARGLHHHRSLIPWEEIERLELEPNGSHILVRLRAGESFRVKVKDLGPSVYQHLSHRVPVTGSLR